VHNSFENNDGLHMLPHHIPSSGVAGKKTAELLAKDSNRATLKWKTGMFLDKIQPNNGWCH
jgi:hypothetical protein